MSSRDHRAPIDASDLEQRQKMKLNLFPALNRNFVSRWAGAGLLMLVTCVAAPAASVRLNDAHYTTSVSRGGWGINGLDLESRTTDATSPIADSLISEAAWLNSRAEAGPLRISSFAASDYPLHDTATASAKSELSFSPEVDSLVPIAIDVKGWGHWYFSLGHATLHDVSAGTTLWNFDWDGQSGTLPWHDHGNDEPRGTASLVVDTQLFAAHEYKLTLFSWVSSQEPSSPHIVMEVTGLEVVPEPGVFALTAMAAIGVVAARRRSK